MRSSNQLLTKQRFNQVLVSLFALGSFLYFELNYKYWYHFMEQYTMFSFTGFYFNDLIRQPGGLNEYVSAFLTQFFYLPFGAAIIISLLLSGIAILYYRFMKQCGTNATIWPAFLPLSLFWIYPVESVTVILSVFWAILFAYFYSLISGKNARYITGVVIITLLYFFSAPANILVALLICVYEGYRGKNVKERLIPSLGLLWALLLPLLAMRTIYIIPMREAFLSKHLYHPEYDIPISFWLILFAFPVVAILATSFKGKAFLKMEKTRQIALLSGLTALIIIAVFFGKHPLEKVYQYDYYARQGEWEKIADDALANGVKDRDALIYANLAASKTGRFNELFMHLPQIGEDGFIAYDPKSRLGLIEAAEVTWQVNHINNAQRFAFVGVLSSQRCIQPRLMKRLVETYIVDEEYLLAAKYIKLLEATLFYKDWAKQQRELLDPAKAASAEWVAERRALRSETDNMYDLTRSFASTLAFMLDDHWNNQAAFEYAMGYVLTYKDLGIFMHYAEILRDNNQPLPKLYQEAVCYVYGVLSSNPEEFQSFRIEKEVQDRFRAFAQAVRTLPASSLKQQFGDTYYYYAQFIPTPKKPQR